MRVLVTGGAGYIGSHTAKGLIGPGHEVVILDTLVTGHPEGGPPGVAPWLGLLLRKDPAERFQAAADAAEALRAPGFTVEEFAHSLNATLPGSRLRDQKAAEAPTPASDATAHPRRMRPGSSGRASTSGRARMPRAGIAASPRAKKPKRRRMKSAGALSSRSSSTPPKNGTRKRRIVPSEQPRSARYCAVERPWHAGPSWRSEAARRANRRASPTGTTGPLPTSASPAIPPLSR